MKEKIETIKNKNIIDMAITFTAMMRVFSKGSKPKIATKIEELFLTLRNISDKKQYQDIHHSFCQWFIKEIYAAEKTFKNKESKQSKNASYGQAAKILDIAIKVYVYYCNRPSVEFAHKLTPFLNGAIDTPIMQYLKSKDKESKISATTIEGIDEKAYKDLQLLIEADIKQSFSGKIYPVQYDDIKWHELNRAQQVISREPEEPPREFKRYAKIIKAN
jgi:hypothetical protein